MPKTYIIVIDLRTNEVVRKVDVTGKPQRQIERVESGMLINMDTENFVTEIHEE